MGVLPAESEPATKGTEGDDQKKGKFKFGKFGKIKSPGKKKKKKEKETVEKEEKSGAEDKVMETCKVKSHLYYGENCPDRSLHSG